MSDDTQKPKGRKVSTNIEERQNIASIESTNTRGRQKQTFGDTLDRAKGINLRKC